MDWSRSKSIFIFVFLILNIFLYSQYMDRYTEGQKVEMPGDKSIEAKLKEDNITYVALPNNVETASFISGKVRNYGEGSLELKTNINTQVKDQHILIASLNEPYNLKGGATKESLKDFFNANVNDSEQYDLWSIDEAQRIAYFFQEVNNQTIYYNDNAYVKVRWDENGNILGYEQSILEKIEEFEQKENIMTPIQVIQILYSRNLLTANSHITKMELGYSTLVQLTKTQVFVPTWEVTLKNSEKETQTYYVNAVDGKVIDIQGFSTEVE